MINVTIKPKLYIIFFFTNIFLTLKLSMKNWIYSHFFSMHTFITPGWWYVQRVLWRGGGFSISVWLSTKIKTEISSAPLIFLWRRQWWNASTVVHMSDSPCITRRTGHCSHLTPLSLRWRLILRGFSYRIHTANLTKYLYNYC